MATKITTRVLADDAVTDAKIADVTLTTATQSASDNTTKIATTAYVTTAIANLADSAPSTLNTLNELAAALNDDASFSTTVTNSIATKLPLAGGSLTGNLLMRNGGNIEVGGYNSGNDKGIIFTPADSASYWHIYNDAGGELVFGRNITIGSSEHMRIDQAGLVGIGQNNPQESLDIRGGDCVLKLDSTTNGSGVSWVKFADQGTVKWGIGLSKNSGNSSSDFTFYQDASSGSPRLQITSSYTRSLYPLIQGGATATAGVGGTMADVNGAELGPGYLNLGRDDTADAAQIKFSKNGASHSYIQTRTNGLGFITDVGNFGFEGGNVAIGHAVPTANLHVKSNSVNHLLHLQRLDDVANRGEPYAELMIQNQEGSGGYNYGGVAIMADNQSHIRFQVGNSDDWAGSGAKRWQMRLGQASGLDRLGIYSWTFGKDLHLWDSSGNQHINGTNANIQMFLGSQGGLFGGNASHNIRAASNLFMLNAGSSNGQFVFEVNGSSRGSISSSSSSGVFSDRDMKENIQDIEIGLSEVLQLRPRRFKYKTGAHETYGFIAQEVETAVPLAVDEIELPEADPEANKTTLKTLDTTSLIAALVKSIQELEARIATLEG